MSALVTDAAVDAAERAIADACPLDDGNCGCPSTDEIRLILEAAAPSIAARALRDFASVAPSPVAPLAREAADELYQEPDEDEEA